MDETSSSSVGRPHRVWDLPRTLKQAAGKCEACGWYPPKGAECVLHGHHVIPLRSGGLDEAANMVVLCPTCHALAHWFGTISHRTGLYVGPRTVAALKARLRRVRGHATAVQTRHVNEAQRLLDSLRPEVSVWDEALDGLDG